MSVCGGAPYVEVVQDFYNSFFVGVSDSLFENGLPKPDANALASYRVVGILLGRCLMECRCGIGQFGTPGLFKFLLGSEKFTLGDLEIFDSAMALGLRNLLLRSGSEGSLYFEDGSGRKVTDLNKLEFVEQKVFDVLVNSRLTQLREIKSGFDDVLGHEMVTTLSDLKVTPTDLMLLLCGENHLDHHMVSAVLRFSGWPSGSLTPVHLKELLSELSKLELRRFLLLATSTPALDSRRFITIQKCPPSERLPVGRSCFRRIDLPAYEDEELLRTKLTLALSHLGDEFSLL